ncbi:twin-arginine translocase TatA/TatE family subunit [Microbacterium sp. NPDC091313]
MTFGLTIEKLLLIGLIAVLVIGPERLPAAAEALRGAVLKGKRMLRATEARVREELGPEVTDVDWQRLDPRRFDPRRIMRDALLAEPDAVPPAAPSEASHAPAVPVEGARPLAAPAKAPAAVPADEPAAPPTAA